MTRTTNVQALVRRTHEERVLAVLRERGGLSRAQIAERVGLSRTTLSEITSDLIARGAIVVTELDGSRLRGSGRRAELLALDPAAGHFVGIDIQHRRVRVVVADAAHEVIASGVAPADGDSRSLSRDSAALDLLDRVAADHGLHFGSLQGIAIGVHGPDASVRSDVQATFAERFGDAVVVDNNTRFAALAEAMSDHTRHGDLAYVRVGDGIGGGLVINGRLVQGGLGTAGEFGHVRVVDDGAECRCRKRGCLETIASIPAILAETRRRGTDVADNDELADAIAHGDPNALAATDRAAAALGRVLAGAAIVLSPEQIVIGGPLPTIAPYVIDRVADVIVDEFEAVGSGRPTVRAARLGDDDGAYGAIAALYHQSPLLVGYEPERPVHQTPTEPRSAHG